MITVIGMWEQGYTEEQVFFEDTVWKQTLSAFDVDRFVMVGPPDVLIPNVTIPEQYHTMDEALDSTSGQRVFLTFSPVMATLLSFYPHPKDAVYIFGNPAENLAQYIRTEDHRVHIKTPNNVDLLACSCVAAVLYDRSLQ